MGLFDDLDIAGAKDNPFEIPDNTYACRVSGLEVKTDKKGNGGMLFTYTVTEGEHAGFEITEWKRLPLKTDKDVLTGKKYEDAKSWIKMRLNDLDVPESRMNSVEADDLVGTECYVTTKLNDGYVNVKNVTTDSGVMDTAASSSSSDPWS